MQTSRLLIAFLALSFFPVISCTEVDKTLTGCLVLERSDIESNWIATGLTNPGKPPADKIQYVTFTPVPSSSGNEITVKVQAFNDKYDRLGNSINLNKGNPCPIQLSGVDYGYNSIDLSTFDILESTGELKKDFKSISLTPAIFPYKGKKYVEFAVLINFEGRGGINLPNPILPCPPCTYCRPPCSENINQDTLLSVDTSKPIY